MEYIENNKKKILFILPFFIIGLIACYRSVLIDLFYVWLKDGDYSYAFLIPIVSGYLIWEKRKKIFNQPMYLSWSGGVLFILFILISIYGMIFSRPSVVRISISLIIISFSLFFFGKDIFKILAFPLFLLIFMIPLPSIVYVTIGVPLKIFSTKLAEYILQNIGIPVLIRDNIINIGTKQLQIADAINGLRYILPLLTLGILYSYFFEKNLIKQIILVVFTIPISIVTNGIRIGLIGVFSQYYGLQVAEKFFHNFFGWLIFMCAFGILIIFHFFLKKEFCGFGIFYNIIMKFMHSTARYLPMFPAWRVFIHRIRGVSIGKGVFIGSDVFIDDKHPERIFIGDFVTVISRTIIMADNYVPNHFKKIFEQNISNSPKVILKNGCYIGAKCIIFPGVCIGEYAIVGAGSIVTNDIPPYTIAVGSPAKVSRYYSSEEVLYERLG